jgi:hypothetical protein
MRSEAGVILVNALKQGDLSAKDKSYLDKLVAARTGLTQADADKQVSEVFTNAKQAGENARRAIAHSSHPAHPASSFGVGGCDAWPARIYL